MASYVAREQQRAMQSVAAAVACDTNEQSLAAYGKYLESIHFMVQQLLLDAQTYGGMSGDISTRDTAGRYLKLCAQCVDRLQELLSQLPPSQRRPPVDTSLPPTQRPPPSHSAMQSPGLSPLSVVPRSMSVAPSSMSVAPSSMSVVSRSMSVAPSSMSVGGSVARCQSIESISAGGDTKKMDPRSAFLISSIPTQRAMSPMELAELQNRQLLTAHKARVAHNPSAAFNLSLSLQRRMAENLSIARQRQSQIKEEVSDSFSKSPSRLRSSSGCPPEEKILRASAVNHCELEKKKKERLDRLSHEAERRFASISSQVSEEELDKRQLFVDSLQYEQDLQWLVDLRTTLPTRRTDWSFVQSFVQAIFWIAQHPLSILLRNYQSTVCANLSDSLQELSTLSRTPSAAHIEHLPALPEDHSTAEEPYSPPSVTLLPQGADARLLSDQVRRCLEQVEATLERLESMFTAVFPELGGSDVQDALRRALRACFYTPGLYRSMVEVYRLQTADKERLLETAMRLNAAASPLDFGVSAKLSLTPAEQFRLNSSVDGASPCDGLGEQLGHRLSLDMVEWAAEGAVTGPYQPAVDDLKRLITLHSPETKLSCIVQSSRLIVRSVADFYADCSSPPGIGADELLPILSYIVVRTQQPQLVTECSLLMDLAQDSEMMSEEGYCLTSLLTAIGYLQTIDTKL